MDTTAERKMESTEMTLMDVARRVAMLWNSGARDEAASRIGGLLLMAKRGEIDVRQPENRE